MAQLTLKVEGMDCANCAMGITRKLTKKGHTQVHVDFATGEACLDLAPDSRKEDVISEIESLGYQVVPENGPAKKTFSIRQKFWFAAIFTFPLFIGHLFFSHDHFLMKPFVQCLLCLPVFLLGIFHFGKSAFASLRSGIPNMDVLIFTGSSAAFLYSLAGMYLYPIHEVHNYLFFETSATIITLVLLGNLLEHMAVQKTTSAIRELTALQPEKARLLRIEFGQEHIEEVPVSQLKKGDLLIVSSGEGIPADGIITEGFAQVDESMISGESVPADKQTGTSVVAGTILLNGPIRIQVTATGKTTTLARIIELVKQAQHDKPPVQQLADKISAIFVPIVLGISLITFLLSAFAFDIAMKEALMRSIAVLVISCPCAMGLATPTAIMVGIGRATRKGILVRGGRTLELLSAVDTVVFDKTGTLTTGKFAALEFHFLSGADTQEIKSVLLAMEQKSTHPLAKAVSLFLQEENITPYAALSELTEKKGLGMEARDANNNHWQIGSWRLLANTDSKMADIYILKNNQVLATVNMQDEIRPAAAELIHFLKAKNIRTILLSGDRRSKCEAVANTIGITEVIPEQLPAEKSAFIAALSKNKTIAMVGDGINDAPALAQAQIGISHGEASQIAMQSAQIILSGSATMEKMQDVFLIGKHTMKTIRQNLFWAFFYNVVAIPIAAFGLLNPMVAALSMAFSDVIVIGNSIRLRTKRLY
jgi:P-type Cu+ transporter